MLAWPLLALVHFGVLQVIISGPGAAERKCCDHNIQLGVKTQVKAKLVLSQSSGRIKPSKEHDDALVNDQPVPCCLAILRRTSLAVHFIGFIKGRSTLRMQR